ncbi:hypothetical protein DPEC_G00103570 [Dallia pectoralis]|uniref:Uncharacterized protein n=1 Tax=Dallia pectoralis TaxID=75939 RepID=A0ACC2GXX0_DALPE|nr:hypothetical protein DPEC_G00103570 [Dallia pectoralis]
MADGERKRLVWSIKKTLLTLSADELFQIAKAVGPVPGMDESRIESTDEDAGDSDVTDFGIASATPMAPASDTQDTELQKILTSYEELSKKMRQYKHTPTPQSVHQSSVKIGPTSQSSNVAVTRDLSENSTPFTQDKLFSLRELSYLHRRELKIQGGQIGDQGSDLSYNSVCRQIENGLKEQFSDAEVVRAVLKVIKPGTFKDMLMNKDDLSVEELKAFLHSHLGDQSNTELFQELMCTKQRDNETPQQFLYRVIGLKQKIMLASKHADTDVKYNASTVQDVFLHTVYQGLGHKHDDVRRELKPLLVDTRVSDEAILKQMKKIMCDESERQRRLGPNTRQRLTNVHSAQSEVNAAQCPSGKEKVPKTDTIQQLTEKLDQLTSMVELMRHSMQTQVTGQFSHNWKGRGDRRREKPYGCDKCVEQNRPDCPHCFHCGEEGHRAVGCLKKPTGQGNWSRSLPRDRQ